MVGLLLCAIVSQAAGSGAALAVDIRLAPPPPPWPESAPPPLMTPAEARIFVEDAGGVGAELSEPGLWLPDELAGIIAGRLEALAMYPARCQARLTALERIHDVVLSGAVEAAWADAEAQAPQGWKWWEVALVGVGSLAVGALVGGGFMLAVTR